MDLMKRGVMACVAMFLILVLATPDELRAAPDAQADEKIKAKLAGVPNASQQDEKQQEQKEKNKEKQDEDEPKTETDKAKQKELEQKACGLNETNYKARTDKKQRPLPEPAPGKAMIYVIRPTMTGNKVQSKLAVDGEWKGTNRGDNYFFFEVDPGEHHFCSRAENRSLLTLSVEAGRTYYLQQKIQMGLMKARNKLVALDDVEGKKGLAKTHLSISEVKK